MSCADASGSGLELLVDASQTAVHSFHLFAGELLTDLEFRGEAIDVALDARDEDEMLELVSAGADFLAVAIPPGSTVAEAAERVREVTGIAASTARRS